MQAAHETFDMLVDLEGHTGKRFAFISERTPRRDKLYKWIPVAPLRQVCFQALTALDMAAEAWRARDVDAFFIYEHKPWYSYLLYAVCVARRKPVFFIVHGIQQTYRQSVVHRLGFAVLCKLERHGNFWPVHIELSDRQVPGVVPFSTSIFMRHPLPCDMAPRARAPLADRPVRIGIAGIMRKDKPIVPLLHALLRFRGENENVEIAVGTPLWQASPELLDMAKAASVSVVETDKGAQYQDFIQSLDIIVAHFERDAFYFRPSGVVSDAIAGGCIVVAPAFPTIEAQMSQPVRCGESYEDLTDLPGALHRAIERLADSAERTARWRDLRASENILADLAAQMAPVFDAEGAPARTAGAGG